MQGSHLCREIRGQQSLAVLALGKSTSLLAGYVAPPPTYPSPGGIRGRAFRPTWRISCALNGGAGGLSSGG